MTHKNIIRQKKLREYNGSDDTNEQKFINVCEHVNWYNVKYCNLP